MKALKITLAVILLFAAIIFIGGIYLPKTYHLKRSIVINAKDSVIFQNVSNFNEYIKWSEWSKKTPTPKFIIIGTPNTVGHTYQWEGGRTGLGQMQIISLHKPKSIEIKYEFVRPFPTTAKTMFTFDPTDKGIKVTWDMVGENSTLFEKWAGLFMGNFIGDNLTASLKSLKEKSEQGK